MIGGFGLTSNIILYNIYQVYNVIVTIPLKYIVFLCMFVYFYLLKQMILCVALAFLELVLYVVYLVPSIAQESAH